jgi:tetratricopeptide (TPR) repeat protein
MFRAAFISIVLSVGLLPSVAFAQQVGDRIVVIHDDAQLRANEATTGSVPKGNDLVVKNVNGDWFWVTFSSGHETVSGWISRSDVIPFSQALDFFSDELKRNPTASAYNNRGMWWKEKGEYDIAIGDYNEAIRLDPTFAWPYLHRGVVWAIKKEYDRAISDFGDAIRIDPKNAQGYMDRGNIWHAKGDYDKAIADYDQAIRLDPKDWTPYYNRGNSWSAKKEYGKAIADYDQAIRLDPEDLNIWGVRAWIEATCRNARFRDGKKAVDDATKHCELHKWNSADGLDTLAAAYAEAGDFDSAVKWQRKAVEMVSGKQKADFQFRLNLYQSHKPYRE